MGRPSEDVDETIPAYHHGIGDVQLDRWIGYAVKVLRDGGLETYESCQGGAGHSLPEPTVRFFGGPGEGHRALVLALQLGLPVFAIRRVWQVIDGEPHGPTWEMTFHRGRLEQVQREAESAGLIK